MFLEFLQYGLIGLSAIMLVLSWRITNAEQRRKSQPRAEFLRHARHFMLFCLVLTVLNGALQAFDYWQKSQSQALDAAKRELAVKAARLESEMRRTSRLTAHVINIEQLSRMKLALDVKEVQDGYLKDRLTMTAQYINDDAKEALKVLGEQPLP